jgi:penicillin G amidase
MAIDPRQALGAGLKGLGLGGALLGSAAAGVLWQLLKRPQPKVEGTIRVRGIEAGVEIARDRWGMPRIRAGSRHDLFFGQGFVHAQDRLWQCDLTRRVCSGRLAEMAGPDGLPLDRLMRTLGLRRLALREEAELDPGLRSVLDAYCAGFNQAVAATSAPLPVEFQILRLDFEPWRPADLLAGAKLLSFGLSTNWERELLRAEMVRELGPERTQRIDPVYPQGNPVVLHPGEGFDGDGATLAEQILKLRSEIGLAGAAGGSNNWAVSAKRSTTGGPLIAGDPHLPAAMPGIWQQNALELGERFCRGAALPGIPGITMGQNNDVVWTFTNAMADVEDLFVERIDGDRYEFDGDWLPLEVTEEEILVKGRSEPERLEVRATRHGPIVNSALGADDAQPLALRWFATDFPGIGRAHLEILEPREGAELVELLRDLTMPVSNLIWADRHGDIGYKAVGRIPRRPGGCPDLPKPGWRPEFEWDGAVPYEEMPELVNPDEGFLVTANNRIADEDFPHHITSDYFDGYRARRVEQLLTERPEHDLDSFRAMQTDLYSIPGDEVVHRLARIEEPGGQREIAAVERLKSWNRELGPDTVAGTIYQAFLLRLAQDFARAAIGDRDLAERWLDRSDSAFTTHVTSPWRWHSHLLALWAEADDDLIGRPWENLVTEALRGALDDLELRFGPDPEGWRWGHVHELRFSHALGANPLLGRAFNRTLHPGGAQETVAQIAYDPGDPFHAIWAPSWRMVADPVDPGRSMWQAFTGQSGHPASPHYDDLQPRWLAGELQPMAGEGPWQTLALDPA